MYDFCMTLLPGFFSVQRGSVYLGLAARRTARKGQKGFWTFEPAGEGALLETFKTKRAIAEWLEAKRLAA